MADITLGLDLGCRQDPSALAVLRRVRVDGEPRPAHDVRSLYRWPLDTPYERVAADVARVLARADLAGAALVADETGVGRPVVEMIRRHAPGKRVVPVCITPGHAVTKAGDGSWRVAKVVLISTLQALLGERRLRLAAEHPLTPVLIEELKDYRVKVTAAANETYNARGGAHDDVLLAVALACWHAERCPGGLPTTAAPRAGTFGLPTPGVFSGPGTFGRPAGRSPFAGRGW